MSSPIQIFYRDCFVSQNKNLPNRRRPEWWEKYGIGNFRCLRNLLETSRMGEKIEVIYDCAFGYGFPYNQILVHKIHGGTEAKSFIECLRYIASKDITPETIIYIVENDYLHRAGAIEALVEAFTIPGVEYATLYDHNDKYLHYPELTSKVFATQSCHWRTVPSTTNTFATRFGTLLRDLETHIKFSEGREVSDDNGKWLALNKMLVSPMPGYSTHCEEGLLSPCIDWKNEI